MPATFAEMVEAARKEVVQVSPAEARRLMEEEGAVVVDVRDRDDAGRKTHGTIPGALNISAGMLPIRADQELPEQYRAPELQDRTRPVITACNIGALAALGAKTLKEMGFERVYVLEGGTQGWKQAGLFTEGTSA